MLIKKTIGSTLVCSLVTVGGTWKASSLCRREAEMGEPHNQQSQIHIMNNYVLSVGEDILILM